MINVAALVFQACAMRSCLTCSRCGSHGRRRHVLKAHAISVYVTRSMMQPRLIVAVVVFTGLRHAFVLIVAVVVFTGLRHAFVPTPERSADPMAAADVCSPWWTRRRLMLKGSITRRLLIVTVVVFTTCATRSCLRLLTVRLSWPRPEAYYPCWARRRLMLPRSLVGCSS